MSTREDVPSPEDMALAAEWLDQYEAIDADDSGQKSCERVAQWLRSQADKRDFRATCKTLGVSVETARRAMKAKGRRPGR